MSSAAIPGKKARRNAWALLALKLFVSFGLLYLVFTTTISDEADFNKLLEMVRTVEAQWLVFAIGLFYVQFSAAMIRLKVSVHCVGNRIPATTALTTVIIGDFFAQVFATFIGGDAIRVWRISRAGITLQRAASAVLIDRAFGFIAILLLVAGFMPLTREIVDDPTLRAGLLLGALAAFGFIVAFFLFGAMPEVAKRFRIIGPVLEMSSASRHVVRKPVALILLILPSLTIHFVNVVAMWALATGVGADWSLLQALSLVPVIVLLATLPISFAGWGVRESATIHALAFLAIPADVALAASVLFGICLIVAALPGAVLWWFTKKPTDMPTTPDR